MQNHLLFTEPFLVVLEVVRKHILKKKKKVNLFTSLWRLRLPITYPVRHFLTLYPQGRTSDLHIIEENIKTARSLQGNSKTEDESKTMLLTCGIKAVFR